VVFVESTQKPVTSYFLSLIGGAIILVTGIIGLAWFGADVPEWGGLGGWMSGMMQGAHNFMGGGEFGFFSVISILGVVAGVFVIIGSVTLRVRPLDHLTWVPSSSCSQLSASRIWEDTASASSYE
jgi:hypothetical protein